MRLVNKSFTFLSVGFLLLFFGKISKVELFQVYFKTLKEVQVRNSVGLDQKSALFSAQDDPEFSDSGLTPAPVTGSALPGISLPKIFGPLKKAFSVKLPEIPFRNFQIIYSLSPRAP
ncbi:MAG: hypothetical protein H6581_27460 [Bacteroidia bacterium]|nr:hypothetical protein [Bacteroidia bacterium]